MFLQSILLGSVINAEPAHTIVHTEFCRSSGREAKIVSHKGGYAGNNLIVDLNTKKIEIEPLSERLAQDFIGGYGLALRLAYDFLKPGTNPFHSSNVIILSSGPLVGTLAPSSARSVVLTKYPQTGAVVCGTTGGSLGPMMKWAGYDNIVILGKADRPVYLKITDGDVEFLDAAFIWGEDIFETTDWIWEKDGFNFSVLAIGQAGERQVPLTLALVDKVHHIGKGGLGAVMGSKNLKAIAIQGTKGIKLADGKKFRVLSERIGKAIVKDPFRDIGVKYGSMQGFSAWADLGISTKNSTNVFSKDRAASLWGPEIYLKQAKKARLACISCLCACKDYLQLESGPFAGLETFISSTYGRTMHWGGRCQVGGIEHILYCQDLANRYGLDAHGVTAVIEWAIDLYQKGIITDKDTNGLKLEYGFETTLALLNQIANKESIGALLGKGFQGAIQELGPEAGKLAMQVKGMDCQWDPRLTRLGTPDFHQVVNPKGPFGSTGASAAYLMKDRPISEFIDWCRSVGVDEESMKRIFDPWPDPKTFNVARLTVQAENWWALCNSLGVICGRPRVSRFYNLSTLVDLHNAATGKDLGSGTMRSVAERNYNLLKWLNVREGFSRKDDAFPKRWFEPLITPEKTYILEDYFGQPINEKAALKLLYDYYKERGWDIDTGSPTQEKLLSLNLHFT